MTKPVSEKIVAVSDGVPADLLIDGLMRGFDLSGFIAYATDSALNIVGLNRRALSYRSCFIDTRQGKLCCADPVCQEVLEKLAQECLESPIGHMPLTASFDIGRSRRHPIKAAQLDGLQDNDAEKHIVFWLRHEINTTKCDPEVLRKTFHLTPAESRLAAELADGIALADTAVKLGITIHTARDRLKSVFLKTRTKRQAELVSLIAQTI